MPTDWRLNDRLMERVSSLDRVHVGVGSMQRTVSADGISLQRYNSSAELRSVPVRIPRRSSERRDTPIGAAGHSIVTRGSCRRGEDEASFKAPCKDADDESSGANKVHAVGEATGAKCDVRVGNRRCEEGHSDNVPKFRKSPKSRKPRKARLHINMMYEQ